jgi:hypothetical protein
MYTLKAFAYGASWLLGIIALVSLLITAFAFAPMWFLFVDVAFVFIVFSLVIGFEHYSDYDSHGT